MNLSYSVVIRTLGNTGIKYQALLQSIKAQTIQPEEIIVVIPHGYELDYKLGSERVVYCEKGMVQQRAVGIAESNSEYSLICDDDIQFAPNMVEELYKYLIQNNLNCCLPMEGVDDQWGTDRLNLRYPLSTRLRGRFTGQMLTGYGHSKYLDVLTYTAGHKVYVNSNELDKCYLCTTACFQCFFIKTDLAKAAHYEEELWLQEGSLTSYAAYDEPVFFSKLNLLGLRMAYALRVRYKHLDAGVGRKATNKIEAKKIRYFSIARNRTIYWYKYIYTTAPTFGKKILALLGGLYGLTNYALLTILINLRPRHFRSLSALFKGYKESLEYIKISK
jgi:glycosyltransferase involved in cell wall biosynthesis